MMINAIVSIAKLLVGKAYLYAKCVVSASILILGPHFTKGIAI